MKDVDFTDECSRSVHTIWKKECSSLARQTVNVHQRERLRPEHLLFYFSSQNLHVNQGGTLTLQTD